MTRPSLEYADDPGKAIELACQRANAWLKVALDDIRIETIVETKAQAAALAAFAVQKQLGKDAELAALEVQRRAERGIGLAVRRGQDDGSIAKVGEVKNYRANGLDVGNADIQTGSSASRAQVRACPIRDRSYRLSSVTA